MVYTAETAALAVLEVRVHLDLSWDLLPADFVLIGIETKSDARSEIETVAHVTDEIAYGDTWLEAMRTPLLRVPSAIVPESSNVLINPLHPAATFITVVSIRSFRFDERLWLPKL